MKVKLIWTTPEGEQLIADMARVSAPENQGKDASKLVGYLVRNQHWSPFEMANAVFEIETTRDIARQLLRHRSFSFQEFSQRYASVDKLPEASLREARMQDQKNRQSSLQTDDAALQDMWMRMQRIALQTAERSYEWALERGIAKEVARSVLPEGLTTSRMYMNGTIRSWMHFCKLRCGNGTQKETQEIAQLISEEMMKLYPVSWKALLEN
jgi:thymidylate synthase (FAD)